jgi:hypothetical protein
VYTRPCRVAWPLVRIMEPGFELIEEACIEGERSLERYPPAGWLPLLFRGKLEVLSLKSQRDSAGEGETGAALIEAAETPAHARVGGCDIAQRICRAAHDVDPLSSHCEAVENRVFLDRVRLGECACDDEPRRRGPFDCAAGKHGSSREVARGAIGAERRASNFHADGNREVSSTTGLTASPNSLMVSVGSIRVYFAPR